MAQYTQAIYLVHTREVIFPDLHLCRNQGRSRLTFNTIIDHAKRKSRLQKPWGLWEKAMETLDCGGQRFICDACQGKVLD